MATKTNPYPPVVGPSGGAGDSGAFVRIPESKDGLGIKITLKIAGIKYGAIVPPDTSDEDILSLVANTLKSAPRNPWAGMHDQDNIDKVLSRDETETYPPYDR